MEVIDLEGGTQVVEMDEIEEFKTPGKPIMPDRLWEDFTAQQAADLLAYLQSLKARK